MQTKQKRDRTGELLEVDIDNTGRLANKLIDIKSEIYNLEKEADDIVNKLIEALKEQHRQKISVRGFTVKIKENFASTTVLVKREKNS